MKLEPEQAGTQERKSTTVQILTVSSVFRNLKSLIPSNHDNKYHFVTANIPSKWLTKGSSISTYSLLIL